MAMTEIARADLAELRANLAILLSTSDRGVPSAVHPEDDMYRFEVRALGKSEAGAIASYFRTGYAAFSTLADVAAWLGEDLRSIGPMLDFASGHGRVTRFFADAGCDVTASDIVPSTVAFLTDELGVRARLSGEDPDSVDLGGPYRFVTVVSLFSHLPEPPFRGWLRRLGEALAPDGVIVFSTHGTTAPPRMRSRLEKNPFQFLAQRESSVLETTAYGSTYVTREWVESALAETGLESLAFLPAGMNGHQDVFVVGRAGGRRRPSAELVPGAVPRACIDVTEPRPEGRCVVSGWALDGRGDRPADGLALYAGTAPVGDGGPFPERHVARPDLAEAFGHPGAAEAGWWTWLDAPSREIWLTAVATDGPGRRGFDTVRLDPSGRMTRIE